MRSINFFNVLLIISAIVFLPVKLSSQVSIGSTDAPQGFSVLELFSNETMGFRLPQLNNEQRIALTATLPPLDATGVSPAMGLQIFNTCTRCVDTWNGREWISLCEGDQPRVPITSCDWTFPESVTLAGATWATRNLAETGRGFVASPHNFGGYFQWGRDADGHQNPASNIRDVRATSPTPGHSDFIVVPSPPRDWLSPSNDALWNSGLNNPCPPGWEVPSRTQLEALAALPNVWVNNFCDGINGLIFGTDNPASFDPALHLFLPAAGQRFGVAGAIQDAGIWGSYWSSTQNDSDNARILIFNSSFPSMSIGDRRGGFVVRCVVAE